AALELDDDVPESLARRLHLANDHEDDADGQRLASAGHDLRARRPQDERAQPEHALDAVAATRVDQYLVDAAHALDGVEQDRPDAARDDHQDLRRVADTGEEEQDGDQHRRRDGPQELQHRLEQAAHHAARADEHTQRDPRDDREEVAREQSHQARHDVVDEPVAEPRLWEDLDDPRQRWLVEVRAVGAGKPPDGEDDDRQAEQHRHAPKDAGHVTHAGTSLRTDGCQASTQRSAARVSRFATTPTRPVTTTRAYIAGTALLV